MGTLNLAMPPSAVTGLPPGLSRRLLRRLIVGHGLGVGSRVLVVGRQTSALVDFLNRLGLVAHSSQTVDAEPSPQKGERRIADDAADELAWDEGGWDLVLGFELTGYDASLSAADALHATAELLSWARPGGYALLLMRTGQPGFAGLRHSPSCFVRHFSQFNGTLVSDEFPDGLAAVDPLSWIVGRRPRAGYLLAGLRLPLAALSRFEWHDQAERAIQSEDCCRWKAAGDQRSAA